MDRSYYGWIAQTYRTGGERLIQVINLYVGSDDGLAWLALRSFFLVCAVACTPPPTVLYCTHHSLTTPSPQYRRAIGLVFKAFRLKHPTTPPSLCTPPPHSAYPRQYATLKRYITLPLLSSPLLSHLTLFLFRWRCFYRICLSICLAWLGWVGLTLARTLELYRRHSPCNRERLIYIQQHQPPPPLTRSSPSTTSSTTSTTTTTTTPSS
jgi:hypothetical protein